MPPARPRAARAGRPAPHPDARLIDPYSAYDDCFDDRPECNDDPDRDGVPVNIDNCPGVPNPEQLDYDGDTIGDACERDEDQDGILGPNVDDPNEPLDNCPFLFNPGRRRVNPDVLTYLQQVDTDGDLKGDACDEDDDNDGVLDCGRDAICDPEDNAVDEDRDSTIDEAGECVPAPADDPDFEPDPDCLTGRTDLFDNDADGDIDEASEVELPAQAYPGPDPDGSEDNCRRIPNADQADFDQDGIGDVCDPDIDGDGIPNCTLNGLCGPQHDLRDNDGDGEIDEVGECVFDPCDIDADWLDQDLDGFTDEGFEVPAEGWPPVPIDNCPWWPTDDLSDRNDDGIGDACADDDSDGHPAYADNCPDVANESQRDTDGDLKGDVCDEDRDGDGRDNAVDVCPDVPDDGADLDGDRLGDACDDDVDGDDVPDSSDNCRRVGNPDQANLDGDTKGDACDDDTDGDSHPDGMDLCPRVPDDQRDTDGDGLGDACDSDDDDDTLPDAEDLCPTVPAPPPSSPGARIEQPDRDGDGLGDACDPVDDRPFEARTPAERCAILLERGASTVERLKHCPTLSRSVSSCQVTPGAPATPGLGLLLLAAVATRRRGR